MDDWKAKRRRRREERNSDDDDDPFSGFDLAGNGRDIVGVPSKRARQGGTHGGHSNNGGVVMTAARRLRMEREEALRLMDGAAAQDVDGGVDGGVANARMRAAMSRRALAGVNGSGPAIGGDDDEEGEKRSAKDGAKDGKTKTSSENTNQNQGEDVGAAEVHGDSSPPTPEPEQAAGTSLLEQAALLKRKHDALSQSDQDAIQRRTDEDRILKEASHVQTNALQAASELAEGVKYKNSLPTGWRCPRKILKLGEDQWNKIRDKWHILVEGEDCPPPIRSFVDMCFPRPIIDCLTKKNVKRPTPIQMQGLTVALGGRDMVGIAFTGSGKTLSFSLPLVMAAVEEEARMPLVPGEGPVGIVLAPSRELARQTYEVVTEFCTALEADPKYPGIRSQLLIGGESGRDQIQQFRDRGVHCVVATPGRLRDFLKKRSITLDICRYICLDEADRMLDLGFDEEVGEIMNHFHHQRQTILYSATFPKKFQDFAKQTLVRPVVVNVGRAGAANLDVIQEVEYVKHEAKIVYLLECLQKTAPPVVIFCEKKGDVDDIHEYLLLKGVEAVSIHGGKDQEERNEAIAMFKAGRKDVLVATDIAAKVGVPYGFTFPTLPLCNS